MILGGGLIVLWIIIWAYIRFGQKHVKVYVDRRNQAQKEDLEIHFHKDHLPTATSAYGKYHGQPLPTGTVDLDPLDPPVR